MAQSLSQLVATRKSVLRQLDQLLRKVDSSVETLQRSIKRLRGRKIKLPEVKDLEALAQTARELGTAYESFSTGILNASSIFTQP